jgi:hypothetical protein
MDEAEAELQNALVVMVGGTRPQVSPTQVQEYLEAFFQIGPDRVQVVRFHPADFLLRFSNRDDADRVLHALAPPGAGLVLVFQWWRPQIGALFSPLRYMVLLPITNIPAHASRWTRRRWCWGHPASFLRPHCAHWIAQTCRAYWSLAGPCIRSSFPSRWTAPYQSRSSHSWNVRHGSSSRQVRLSIQSVTLCSSRCSFGS